MAKSQYRFFAKFNGFLLPGEICLGVASVQVALNSTTFGIVLRVVNFSSL